MKKYSEETVDEKRNGRKLRNERRRRGRRRYQESIKVDGSYENAKSVAGN